MFPKEYLLVTYLEHDTEIECNTWILEFLFPVEEKARLLKMQEIIEEAGYELIYEIIIQPMVFENESYYNGFVDAKINYAEEVAPEILSNETAYNFAELLHTLPNEKKLVNYINERFNKNFTDLLDIKYSIDDSDESEILAYGIDCKFLKLEDIFYKSFTKE
jgi:hypothetical protein